MIGASGRCSPTPPRHSPAGPAHLGAPSAPAPAAGRHWSGHTQGQHTPPAACLQHCSRGRGGGGGVRQANHRVSTCDIKYRVCALVSAEPRWTQAGVPYLCGAMSRSDSLRQGGLQVLLLRVQLQDRHADAKRGTGCFCDCKACSHWTIHC
jgi:hypothetical protein